jgi:hypothetical protein
MFNQIFDWVKACPVLVLLDPSADDCDSSHTTTYYSRVLYCAYSRQSFRCFAKLLVLSFRITLRKQSALPSVRRMCDTSQRGGEMVQVQHNQTDSAAILAPIQVFPSQQFNDLQSRYGDENVKLIHMVLHAEGTHNVHKEYKDAINLDARLTTKGIEQCAKRTVSCVPFCLVCHQSSHRA